MKMERHEWGLVIFAIGTFIMLYPMLFLNMRCNAAKEHRAQIGNATEVLAFPRHDNAHIYRRVHGRVQKIGRWEEPAIVDIAKAEGKWIPLGHGSLSGNYVRGHYIRLSDATFSIEHMRKVIREWKKYNHFAYYAGEPMPPPALLDVNRDGITEVVLKYTYDAIFAHLRFLFMPFAMTARRFSLRYEPVRSRLKDCAFRMAHMHS